MRIVLALALLLTGCINPKIEMCTVENACHFETCTANNACNAKPVELRP